jgi:hypothetical protein
MGCYKNSHFIHAAYYSSVADTIQWLSSHPINLPWLPTPLSTTLKELLSPSVQQLQRWNIPIATTCPTSDIHNKSDVPLSIPSPQCIPDWPPHLFPSQGDFGRHIKAQLKSKFINNAPITDQLRLRSIGRHQFNLHPNSHLTNPNTTKSQLWQCSTSLFSLTSFQKLSNQAFITSTSLILGIPVQHALFLHSTQQQHHPTDIWADNLLNKSSHAAESRKTSHTQLAQELTKIANECGIPTTCTESRLPYSDNGLPRQSKKLADMMTLSWCGLTPNPQLSFTSTTRLVMDITIGHTYTATHHFKPHTLQTMESTKRRKYSQHFQRQGLAFAPMVANTLGRFGPDLLQFLWNLANHNAQLTCGFNIETAVNISSEQAMDYRKLRAGP